MEPREEVACPACGESILATAKKCRFCGEWRSETASSDAGTLNNSQHPSLSAGEPLTKDAIRESWRNPIDGYIIASLVTLAGLVGLLVWDIQTFSSPNAPLITFGREHGSTAPSGNGLSARDRARINCGMENFVGGSKASLDRCMEKANRIP